MYTRYPYGHTYILCLVYKYNIIICVIPRVITCNIGRYQIIFDGKCTTEIKTASTSNTFITIYTSAIYIEIEIIFLLRRSPVGV